ncbi:PspC domain-containing protein, partial [Xanthomonas citri pv. citri]|nr:PspC domain-containing protein [Xanthomonas citri pv. citri]
GVCQGIANSLNLDPTVVRVVAALLILLAGSGPLIYLVLWAIIPDEGSGSSMVTDLADRTRCPHKSEGTEGSSAPFNPYKD